MSGRERFSDQLGSEGNFKPVLVSVGVGVVVCILILLALSALLVVRSIPQSMISPMAIFAISVGGFSAGFCCARITRSRGLALGAVCGTILSLLVLLASFSLKDNAFGVLAILKIVFIMLSSMLGGVMGVNARSRRKR